MKILLLLSAASATAICSSCRTVYPLCPMTMEPTYQIVMPAGVPQPCQFRQDNPRVCSPTRVRVIATK
jgi:hypothetical protein